MGTVDVQSVMAGDGRRRVPPLGGQPSSGRTIRIGARVIWPQRGTGLDQGGFEGGVAVEQGPGLATVRISGAVGPAQLP